MWPANLLVLLTASSIAPLTSAGSLSRISSRSGSLSSPSRVCVQDAVDLTWAVNEWSWRTELIWIEVLNESGAATARFDLFQARALGGEESSSSLETVLVDGVPKTLEMMHSVIQSWDYGVFKTPNVQTAEWTSSAHRELVVLTFSEPTNRPVLEGPVNINNALELNYGDIRVSTGRGVWSADGLVLTLSSLDPETWRAITSSISDGTFRATPRMKPLVGTDIVGAEEAGIESESPEGQLRGNLTMRMSSPGRFVLRLFVGERLDFTAEVINVELCPEQVIVAGNEPDRESVEVPRAFFVVEGVLSMPGEKWLKVPSSLFPAHGGVAAGGARSEKMVREEHCSWSFAFWIYLLGDAPDSFRGLFYKGDGDEMGRTPSAWLRPHSNRITLRVTTDSDPDVGIDSRASLAAGTWSHVAFSFDNNPRMSFSASIYINGTLDVSMAFNGTNVVGNDGPLHIGRDPSNLGPRLVRLKREHLSLISLVRLWEGTLSPLQIEAVFQSTKPLFVNEASTALASRFPSVHAVISLTSRMGRPLSYSSLLLTGRERIDGDAASLCGREKEAAARSQAVVQWNSGGAESAVDELELAVQGGSHQAAYMLSTIMLSGLGGTIAHSRSSPDASSTAESSKATLKTWNVSTTARAIALLHFAAASIGGHPEAQLALGLRYLEEYGVQLDLETAAFYLACAADKAHADFHLVGQQPIIEAQRLTAANEAIVEIGQKGEDDDAIQYQIHRAEHGDIRSMESLGDIFYWGARGVSRDQARALHFFTRASESGSNSARCAAAGMYLKGEGTNPNHTRAVELFELAANENHVRALNGLGYVYFNGHVLPQNLTKAYSYFEQAANMRQEADSLFNAAHCLAHGLGTDQDLPRAAELFRLGASWGHVDSAYELGYMYAQGTGVQRSPALSAKYLTQVAQVGPWGRRLRQAFDCYIQGDILSALALYAQVAELGYEVAASNAAFLLERGKVRFDGEIFQGGGDSFEDRAKAAWAETMCIRFHFQAALKGYLPSFLAIGDAFFYGRAGLPR
ncbi:unnamed protein product [Scytosiphon promiscuus]